MIRHARATVRFDMSYQNACAEAPRARRVRSDGRFGRNLGFCDMVREDAQSHMGRRAGARARDGSAPSQTSWLPSVELALELEKEEAIKPCRTFAPPPPRRRSSRSARGCRQCSRSAASSSTDSYSVHDATIQPRRPHTLGGGAGSSKVFQNIHSNHTEAQLIRWIYPKLQQAKARYVTSLRCGKALSWH